MTNVVKSPQALVEILDAALYIAEDSPDAGADFIDKVEESCALLATQPTMGTRYRGENVAIQNVRFVPVKKFVHFLIFYRVHEDTVEILRVIHGARDLPLLLS